MSQSETQLARKDLKKTEMVKPPAMPGWGVELIRFFGLRLSRLLFGIKYEGLENIPQQRTGGLLICANHQSFFDPFWICFPIKKYNVRFMTWDRATRWFLVGSFIRAMGGFPVDLERGGKDALKMSLGWLRAGGTVAIFPEGSRSNRDGKLLDFKPGAVRIALQAGVPILPVTIINANKVWAQDMKMPGLAKIKLVFHPVFELPPVPKDGDLKIHVEELTQKLKDIIASALPPENR